MSRGGEGAGLGFYRTVSCLSSVLASSALCWKGTGVSDWPGSFPTLYSSKGALSFLAWDSFLSQMQKLQGLGLSRSGPDGDFSPPSTSQIMIPIEPLSERVLRTFQGSQIWGLHPPQGRPCSNYVLQGHLPSL